MKKLLQLIGMVLMLSHFAVANTGNSGEDNSDQDTLKNDKLGVYDDYLIVGVGLNGRTRRYGSFDQKSPAIMFTYQRSMRKLVNSWAGVSWPEWVYSGFMLSYVSYRYNDLNYYWGSLGDVVIRSFAIGERNTAMLDEALINIVNMPVGLKPYVGFEVGFELQSVEFLDQEEEDYYYDYLYSHSSFFFSPYIGVAFFPTKSFGGFFEIGALQSTFKLGLQARW